MSPYSPRIGEIGLVETSGFFGKLIRVGTQSRWNHSIIYVGNGFIVEANPQGVHLKPVSEHPKVAWSKHIEFTPEQGQIAANYAQTLLGKPYNFFDIAVLALRILGLRFLTNGLLTRLGSKSYGYICSELTDECWAKADIPTPVQDSEIVSPGDQAEFFLYN
jgi:hypothetical protein